ncbi:MAG: light-harvesting antenna LH1, beta subunit [Halieaceae bacterium]|nr:light-harvesting antenna LH1, beta subunit [Halieaceae bacterium]
MSGLSGEEAKEFHGVFMSGFLGFTAVAVVAHILVFMWKPWF